MKKILLILALCMVLSSCSVEQKAQFGKLMNDIDRDRHPLKYASQDAADDAKKLCNFDQVKNAKQTKEYQHCYQQAYPVLLQAHIQKAAAMEQSNKAPVTQLSPSYTCMQNGPFTNCNPD